jgi:hypothetical protein
VTGRDAISFYLNDRRIEPGAEQTLRGEALWALKAQHLTLSGSVFDRCFSIVSLSVEGQSVEVTPGTMLSVETLIPVDFTVQEGQLVDLVVKNETDRPLYFAALIACQRLPGPAR